MNNLGLIVAMYEAEFINFNGSVGKWLMIGDPTCDTDDDMWITINKETINSKRTVEILYNFESLNLIKLKVVEKSRYGIKFKISNMWTDTHMEIFIKRHAKESTIRVWTEIEI